MSSSYLRTTPERLVDEFRGQLAGAERQEGGGPVERLGDARDLGQVGLAEPMHEPDDLAGQALAAHPGTRASTISYSFWAVG